VPGSERREQHGCAQSPYIGVLAALLVLIAAALAWTHFGSTSELGLPAGWRFPSALGTPLDPDNVSHWFSRVCRRAGLGHWHLHELRHSGASLMLAQGTDLYVVSEVLGHSSVAITKDVYGHLVEGQKRAAACSYVQGSTDARWLPQCSQSAPAPGADAG
jgi:integrase